MQTETVITERTQLDLLKLRSRRTTRWVIETSHLVAIPTHIDANGLVDLRRQVQHIADTKRTHTDRPPIGDLEYRYELDEQERPIKVHCFFIDSRGKRRRFMRLRREL